MIAARPPAGADHVTSGPGRKPRLQRPKAFAARPGQAGRGSAGRALAAALGSLSWLLRGSSPSSGSLSKAAWLEVPCTWRMIRGCWGMAIKEQRPSKRLEQRCLQLSRNGRITQAGSFHPLQNLTFLSLNPGTQEFRPPCLLYL